MYLANLKLAKFVEFTHLYLQNQTNLTNFISTQFRIKYPKSSPSARICTCSSSTFKLDANMTWKITVTPFSGSTSFKVLAAPFK